MDWDSRENGDREWLSSSSWTMTLWSRRPDAGFWNQLRRQQGGGQPPACPPARASVSLSASAKLKDAWCHVLLSEGARRLSVTVRASVLHGLGQTPPHVNNPRVCEKWAGLWKLHIHCSCGPADSWRRAEDLCSLSPHPTPPPPALPPPFFYVSMKQTCNFHSCVPAVSQGGRQREDEERGAGWCHLENYRLQHSFANPEY